ncbi:phytoene desaturase family protein [Promicromonospora citrea]|uniref:Pyridine nucleotide-disulfide oxidoreductase domain-containing protein 2 n=1 Tax=Promicromonospora citrea TaxID=43677 RepID=A0A8H9L488_9MICO|nr:NAD(P)/FAD-dependent oxidoreductase [Promicromonospora citrea]NNH52939.1 NAD(P)/FAD-dependent oxidoreductase [Promicromonospora citrea]GGM32656.1 dehydrogenase [Promicromonospora citrea]
MVRTVDAVVVGAGPNGLVAANALVDAGWDVLVLEEQPAVGGAVRTAEVAAPGFRTDLFSAFYPLAAGSPVIRDLHLEEHGLAWSRAPSVLAHVLDDGPAAVLHALPEDTAAGLEEQTAGDGEAWLRLFAGWTRVRDPLLDALFSPLPAARHVARLLRRLGTGGALDLARLAVLPVRRLADETFRGEGGGLLLTGNAMHADVPADAAGSGLFGWLLSMLGQDVGFPVPVGGAGELAAALAARVRAGGGVVETGTRVERVLVSGGRAVGVTTARGGRVRVRRAVLADVSAPALYRDLVGTAHLPDRLVRDLDRFQWDHPTFKVNWALDRPLPWRSAGAHGAGTVHLGVDRRGFVDVSAALSKGEPPDRPFLVLGQMTTADPTRSPAGTESAWAYTHVPHGTEWTVDAVAGQVRRVEDALERAAPGFRDAVVGRSVQSPAGLQAADANLAGGAVNGGTSAVHQQLFFRPTPGLGRPETPVAGLYLASASAHPGGGVHGACGWNAARVALAAASPWGRLPRALARSAWGRLLQDG